MKYPHALALAILLVLGTAWAKEKFAEEGLIEWLEDGRLLLHLHFYQDTDAVRHTTFFPTAILDLAQRSNFEELQLHLTRGRWDHATWGPPKFPIHPAGAELEVAWPEHLGQHLGSSREWHASVNGRAWSDLTHRLSGLLCSSLNLLAAPDVVARHVHPLLLHQQLQEGPRPQLHRQYAALPREAICTENLTPWLKLLPCRDAAGLATLLLDRKQLFGGGYHSLSTNVGVLRDQAGALKSVRLTQTATAVLFVPSGFPEGPPSLSTFFPGSLTRACQAATSSNLYLRQSAESGAQKQQREKMQYKGHDVLAVATQSTEGLQSLMAEARLPELNGSSLGGGTYAPPVVARRALTGAGTFKGHYQLSIDVQGLAQGPADKSPEVLCVYQVIPWFIRLWVHTLSIRLDGKIVHPSQMLFHHLQPSNDRSSPLVLEFCLSIPPGSQMLDVSAEFTKLFLTVFEHPPDAHRGFDIPAAIVSFFQHEGCHSNQGPNTLRAALKPKSTSKGPCIREVYSEGSLVQLATPDFSMPYNVICLSSTVMGVFVGSTLNTMTFRPGKLLTLDPKTKRRRKIRMAIGIVLLLGVGVGMAVQVDAEFAGQVDWVLKLLGLPGLQ